MHYKNKIISNNNINNTLRNKKRIKWGYYSRFNLKVIYQFIYFVKMRRGIKYEYGSKFNEK